MSQRIWAVIGMVAVTAIGGCIFGCAPGTQGDARTLQMAQQALAAQAESSPLPSEISGGIKDLTAMIKDQGVISTWLANCEANGIDPGLAIEKSVITKYKIGLDGFTGKFEARAGGDSTRLPSDVRLQLINEFASLIGKTDAASVEERAKLVELLGWNRTAAGGNTGAKPAP